MKPKRVIVSDKMQSGYTYWLTEPAGKNFDPEVIDAFFDSLDTLKAIAKRYPDVNGE